MPNYVRTLTVVYDTDIQLKEISLFRGAIIGTLGDKADVLYHNHTGEDTYRYAYPLIQYKRIKGKAAIVCIERGADLIGEVMINTPDSIKLGDREVPIDISKVIPSRMVVQTWEDTFNYHISRWLPLNSKNYVEFQSLGGMVEKVVMLENLLVANLLSMLKGLGIHLEKELTVKLVNLSEPYVVYHKGVGMTAFNADFTTNLSIPNNFGIGKNASIGCGVVRQVRHQETDPNGDNKEENQNTEES